MHICGELGTYGAENVVLQLVRNTEEPDMDVRVMTINRPSVDVPELSAPPVAVDRRGRGDFGFLGRMVRELRRLRPEVVHTHAHHGRYWGRLAAVVAGVPIIVHTEHNPNLTPPQPRLVFDALNRLLAPRTAAFVDFTTRRRMELAAAEGIAPERIAVIPNGMPDVARPADARREARRALQLADDEPAVMVLARLFPQKRLDRAIEALAVLEAPLRDRVRLVLVGEGPLRDDLTALARERGVAQRVLFTGFRADARDLLPGADLALLSSDREAMPLALIEAMLEGVPIVTVPWSGSDELLGGGSFGLIAASFAPADLALVLAEALRDPAGARQRADHARAHALVEFDVRTQARRYAALYRSLAAARDRLPAGA